MYKLFVVVVKVETCSKTVQRQNGQ